jgi:hypothetical protein
MKLNKQIIISTFGLIIAGTFTISRLETGSLWALFWFAILIAHGWILYTEFKE